MSLLTADHGGGGTLAASDAASFRLEELQFSLGEGPGIDAFSTRRPVLVPILAKHGPRHWPGYAAAADDHAVRAVFAFPLQVGPASLGALTIYRDASGPLSTRALREALAFADVAVSFLLDDQRAAAPSEPGGLHDVLSGRVELYQAQGIVMVEHGLSVTDAMARMRGHAFIDNRDVIDVARDIVAGRLTLERDPPASNPSNPSG